MTATHAVYVEMNLIRFLAKKKDPEKNILQYTFSIQYSVFPQNQNQKKKKKKMEIPRVIIIYYGPKQKIIISIP